MVFGEHLGQPPGYGGYIDAGMRLVDNDLRSWLNDHLGSPWNGIAGWINPAGAGWRRLPSRSCTRRATTTTTPPPRTATPTYFTRAGLPLIYTDGNYHAETLGESGGAFPRHANTAFLGQFGDNRVPNILYVHNHFARGDRRSAYGDGDFIAYERLDYREGHAANAQKVVMIFMMNDNYSAGASRPVSTSFPAQGGTANDAYLYNYSVSRGGFYLRLQPRRADRPPGRLFHLQLSQPRGGRRLEERRRKAHPLRPGRGDGHQHRQDRAP
ncbi:MAG: hypothetical protein U1F77_19890 [Kiritimatiellia bacterium]